VIDNNILPWMKQKLHFTSHGYDLGGGRGPCLLVDPETINL